MLSALTLYKYKSTLRLFLLGSVYIVITNMLCSASGGGDAPSGHVIFPSEAEAFVRELRIFKLADIGSEKQVLYLTVLLLPLATILQMVGAKRAS